MVRRRSEIPIPVAKSGLPIDAGGGPTVDPTANVIALSEASNRRQDDLRLQSEILAQERTIRLEESVAHIKELSEIREIHAREMRISEAARLDSIRQVDVTAVRTEATRALEAIQTLAATSARDAETLRTALVNTATTIASQTSETVKQITERIAALEKSSYEGVGKQRMVDPQMAELLAKVERLTGTKSEGIDKSWGIIVVIIGLAIAAATYLRP